MQKYKVIDNTKYTRTIENLNNKTRTRVHIAITICIRHFVISSPGREERGTERDDEESEDG